MRIWLVPNYKTLFESYFKVRVGTRECNTSIKVLKNVDK